jgi:hypothetical protein
VTFEEILAQVVEVLRRERWVSYRALRRWFGLDEEYLEDLQVEIIQAKRLVTDAVALRLMGESTARQASPEVEAAVSYYRQPQVERLERSAYDAADTQRAA